MLTTAMSSNTPNVCSFFSVRAVGTHNISVSTLVTPWLLGSH
jgi:hypothetical protein